MKNPNIIRVGDRVKIVNPEVYIRCGYRYSLMEAERDFDNMDNPEMKKLRGEMWDVLESLGIDRPTLHNNPTHMRVVENVKSAILYGLVAKNKFGGNDRIIVTETFELLKDKEYTVDRIFFKKTGTRTFGGSVGWYGNYDDCDPNYLSNEKTHKILQLSHRGNRDSQATMSAYYQATETVNNGHLYIQSTNVEKIYETI